MAHDELSLHIGLCMQYHYIYTEILNHNGWNMYIGKWKSVYEGLYNLYIYTYIR